MAKEDRVQAFESNVGSYLSYFRSLSDLHNGACRIVQRTYKKKDKVQRIILQTSI